MDAISTAAGGLADASRRFEASATRTASGGADLATEAVEQVSSKTAFQGNLAVLKTADAMSGALLDIKV